MKIDHSKVYALAHVYSYLQIGDLQLIVSCLAWYDNKYFIM